MTRADLHRLVDELPDASAEAVAIARERAKDSAIAAQEAAPWDDEPYTEAERAEDEAAVREPAIPWERVRDALAAQVARTPASAGLLRGRL